MEFPFSENLTVEGATKYTKDKPVLMAALTLKRSNTPNQV